MRNERYHGPLIESGANLGYIKLFPWISLFVSSVSLWGTTFIDKVGIFQCMFIFCVSVSLFSILWSFSQRLFLRFQSFTYMLVALITFILVLDFNFIGLVMCVGNSGLYSIISAVYNAVMFLLFFLACGIYAWHYLPQNQGKVWKINQWETYGVKSKGKKKEWLTNFGAAFGAVLFVPALLTGYIENAFGIFLGLLITSTLSAVIVDALYAAVYVRKHPEDDSP
ncbi:hypothetical protein [Streptococcus macacae]|uniref:Membrane protein n=1 Tax=Streptococcus macacae NCTC 11558 TaxID=764298 RepID=G5JX96_9STRE|nr:hypothetical protein [Streptococcus macacae]EHJ52873.1 putative membrane protein [Streptococcus macacae NCTC 11558]SUN77869.1 membrane protein [Streptococcus macacae NCTC 11558]